jgi:hypothetical protein
MRRRDLSLQDLMEVLSDEFREKIGKKRRASPRKRAALITRRLPARRARAKANERNPAASQLSMTRVSRCASVVKNTATWQRTVRSPRKRRPATRGATTEPPQRQ